MPQKPKNIDCQDGECPYGAEYTISFMSNTTKNICPFHARYCVQHHPVRVKAIKRIDGMPCSIQLHGYQEEKPALILPRVLSR